MSKDNLARVPDSCTLPTVERPLRHADFKALFAETVRNVDRRAATHLRLDLVGPVGLDVRVRDLANRESGCCPFFAFTVTAIGPGVVTFDITVDADHVDVLDSLAAAAAGNRGSS
jgi:hypothetical protein